MQLFDAIAHAQNSSAPVALAAILHQDGSTPRTAGARMLVHPGGGIEGTIGGGLVEAQAMTLAAEVLTTGVPVTMDYDLAGRTDPGMDMICGGRMEVLVERLDAAACAAFAALAGHLAAGRCAAMITTLAGTPLTVRRDVYFVDADGRWTPHEKADPALVRLLPQVAQAWEIHQESGLRRLVEAHAPRASLYLFGAGHVSQATAEVAHVAGYRVVVLDDRPEFANAARFPRAARIIIPSSLENVFTESDLATEPMGPQSHLAILTRGHRHDATVLAQSLRTPAGWIGMIGSRTKRDATYRRLRQEGFGDADFARVACPIGLALGAQTPGEIAVSIVAQLIQYRAAKGTGAS